VLAARIEDASLAVAQPRQQSFYDGWLLRFSPGKAKRARSINTIGAGSLPLGEKLEHCTRFYAQHGLPCLFRITPFSLPSNLDRELDAAGFGAFQDTRVMTLDLARASLPAVVTTSERWIDVDQFAAAFGALHGLDANKAEAERERYARSAGSVYIAQYDGDMPVGCGSVAVDGTLAGIFGMVTAAAHRGRGIATALLSSLLHRARDAGAHTAYLQVEHSNAPARHAYSGFGFEDCYAYWYRALSAGAEFESGSRNETRETANQTQQ
jgi:GNAT superfamily N-acetyltransferase